MSNVSGVSRGDRSRNARLAKLRELVPAANAIVGIDLADRKQTVVVTDHDSKVIARRTFTCRAWDLGAGSDWAAGRAGRGGFTGTQERELMGQQQPSAEASAGASVAFDGYICNIPLAAPGRRSTALVRWWPKAPDQRAPDTASWHAEASELREA